MYLLSLQVCGIEKERLVQLIRHENIIIPGFSASAKYAATEEKRTETH